MRLKCPRRNGSNSLSQSDDKSLRSQLRRGPLIGRRCWIADRLPVILLNAAFVGFHDEALGFTSFWVVGETSQTFAIVRDRALIVQSYLSCVYFGCSAAAPNAQNASNCGGKPHGTKN
jgi:hypothetical protein